MFDKAKVITGLYGLVGLRQPTNTVYAKLDAANYGSRSGYYSSDNSFCKVEFLIDGMDDSAATDPQINTFIKQLQESAITDVCNNVFNEQDYIDRNFLYKNPLNLLNTETVPAGFVGYEIKVSSKKNIAFEISRIILNFKNTGTIKLLLFQSNISAPIQSKSITVTAGGSQVVDLGWVVDNTGTSYKGNYYLGYVTSAMTGTLLPYKRDFNDAIVKSEISELTINNVYVPNVTTEAIWDLSTNQLGNDNCFGLNPDITVYKDYTDLILRNEKMFAKAVDLAFQIKIINSYLNSLRSNKNERISSEMAKNAMLEIDGVVKTPGIINKTGLMPSLLNEIAAIKTQIEKIKEGYFGNYNGIKLITLT